MLASWGETVNKLSVALVVSFLLATAGARDMAAQCRAAPDTAGMLVNGVRLAYANMDTAFVRSQGEPVAAPSEITLVTNSNTCKSAVSAYNKTHGLTGASGIRSGYVVALGRAGYIVINPAQTTGEYTMMYLYNDKWVFKRALAG